MDVSQVEAGRIERMLESFRPLPVIYPDFEGELKALEVGRRSPNPKWTREVNFNVNWWRNPWRPN